MKTLYLKRQQIWAFLKEVSVAQNYASESQQRRKTLLALNRLLEIVQRPDRWNLPMSFIQLQIMTHKLAS